MQVEFIDWYRDFRVQAALTEVGLPDGSEDWWADFTATLLAITDRVAEGIGDTDADRVAFLADQWRDALAPENQSIRTNGLGAELPFHIIRELTDILGIETTARYLGESQAQVARWRFPRIDMGALHDAAARYQAGAGMYAAADAAGISYDTLLSYVKAMRIPAPVVVCADGRRKTPREVRDRIIEMGNEGLGVSDIQQAIADEFPNVGTLKYHAVYRILSRAA